MNLFFIIILIKLFSIHLTFEAGYLSYVSI